MEALRPRRPVQNEIRADVARLVKAQVGKRAVSQPFAGDRDQKPLGHDHIGVDIGQRQWSGDSLDRFSSSVHLSFEISHISQMPGDGSCSDHCG